MTRYDKEVIAPGDRASKLGHEVCVESYGNCGAVEIVPQEDGNFRGAVDHLWHPHILEQMLQRKMAESAQNDGGGGKPQFFTLLGTVDCFGQLGWEIIVMCADDLARTGRFPAIMINEVQFKRVTDENFHLVKAMLQGYGTALSKSRLVNITGETAVMKHSITAFCDDDSDAQLILTWSGVCLGLSHRDAWIDSSTIEPGMEVIGLWEPGYRCNGGTFMSELLLDWPDSASDQDRQRFLKGLTVPSQSYARAITEILGWQPDGAYTSRDHGIHGIAHITGGGLWEKFGELLPKGVGADLGDMPEPAPVLLQAQQLSQCSPEPLLDWHAYKTFHGGCGMLVVCRPAKTLDLLQELRRRDIEAQIVGNTTPSRKGEVRLISRFGESTGARLSSLEPPE